jgi:hypothetical protein
MHRTVSKSAAGLLASLVAGMIFAGPTAAQNERRVQVVVPAAEFLIISGEDDPTERRPARRARNPLILSLPVDSTGSVRRPETVENLIETLRTALPLEYKRRLLMRFGFERGRAAPKVGDLRLVDLSRYLFEVFDLGDTDRQLGRDIACLSPGGYDLTPIFVTLVARELEADNRNRRRRDVPRDLDTRSIFAVSDRLLFSCRVDP